MTPEGGNPECEAGGYRRVIERITAAEESVRVAQGSTTLVAVSKTHSQERIRRILENGHRVFGENRVQEAAAKWPGLKQEFQGVELHLVGPLQTNKARDAVQLFDVIQSLDRTRLVHAAARAVESTNQSPRFFIQVNTGGEMQKSGCAPDETEALLAEARRCALDVTGLMCIPPIDDDPLPHFRMLAQIARSNKLQHLSMGMSKDFESAIAFGATHVRVGTAVFGQRTIVPH